MTAPQKTKLGNTRQIKLLKGKSENISREHPKSDEQLALDAGYAPSTAKKACRIINTKSFQVLAHQQLPDTLILRKHREGLNATETRLASFEGEFTDERKLPDYRTRWQYIEGAYKLKGQYGEDDNRPQPNDFSQYSPEEIREVFAQLVLRIGTYIPRGSR